MEVAQGEEDGLDLDLLVLKLSLVEEGESSLQVSLETCGRLVSELDRSLEQADRDLLGGIGSQEETELRIRAFVGVDSESLLELKEEVGHQMHVLKHNPVTFLVGSVEVVVSNDVLSLTQGNSLQMLLRVQFFAEAKSFDILNRVCTGRQDEEDWSDG